MRAVSVKQMAKWGTAVLLFLVVCHAAPGTANAECNHPLASNLVRSADWNDLDPLIVGDSSPMVADARVNDVFHKSRTPFRKPCSGASCSKQVPVPSSTAAQSLGGFDQWGDLPATFCDQAGVRAKLSLSEPSCHSQGEKISIFHPPPF
jgi:hypothetical protein